MDINEYMTEVQSSEAKGIPVDWKQVTAIILQTTQQVIQELTKTQAENFDKGAGE